MKNVDAKMLLIAILGEYVAYGNEDGTADQKRALELMGYLLENVNEGVNVSFNKSDTELIADAVYTSVFVFESIKPRDFVDLLLISKNFVEPVDSDIYEEIVDLVTA
jgi:hypothetical protein